MAQDRRRGHTYYLTTRIARWAVIKLLKKMKRREFSLSSMKERRRKNREGSTKKSGKPCYCQGFPLQNIGRSEIRAVFLLTLVRVKSSTEKNQCLP
jgi:hypothetical protein